MLNPTETRGREKGFFYAPALLLPWPLALCMCVHVCPCMLGREKEFKSEWRCHCQTLASTWICSRTAILAACVCVEWESPSGGLPFPLHAEFLRLVIGARQDAGLYFILFIWGRPFHLPHTCFPLDVCLFSPMMCLAMEASHLSDIENRSEGLLKQTQYPKPLFSLYELWRE